MESRSLFEEALSLERSNRYSEAYSLFKKCLVIADLDKGDLLFHLGWCIENGNIQNGAEASELYQQAADQTGFPTTKMNALFRSGWLAMHLKDFRKAANFYQKTIACCESRTPETHIYTHAIYWYAVCLETLGRFLDALQSYARAEALSPMLGPESRYRQILCKTQIGAYVEALDLCTSFSLSPPPGFSEERYRELQTLVEREGQIIHAILAENF